MSRVFEFSKGKLEVSEKNVTGSVIASTSMQQMPGELAIDTPIDKFGPISINDLRPCRLVSPLECSCHGSSGSLFFLLG